MLHIFVFCLLAAYHVIAVNLFLYGPLPKTPAEYWSYEEFDSSEEAESDNDADFNCEDFIASDENDDADYSTDYQLEVYAGCAYDHQELSDSEPYDKKASLAYKRISERRHKELKQQQKVSLFTANKVIQEKCPSKKQQKIKLGHAKAIKKFDLTQVSKSTTQEDATVLDSGHVYQTPQSPEVIDGKWVHHRVGKKNSYLPGRDKCPEKYKGGLQKPMFFPIKKKSPSSPCIVIFPIQYDGYVNCHITTATLFFRL